MPIVLMQQLLMLYIRKDQKYDRKECQKIPKVSQDIKQRDNFYIPYIL